MKKWFYFGVSKWVTGNDTGKKHNWNVISNENGPAKQWYMSLVMLAKERTAGETGPTLNLPVLQLPLTSSLVQPQVPHLLNKILVACL